MSTPDAYDADGQPLYLQDCLTVCPAAHIAEAREIAAWHCLNVENLVDTTVESMLAKPVGPVGGGITHYICFQRIYPENIAKERNTLSERSVELPWIDGSESPANPLETFCCLNSTLEDFLSLHSMEVK